MEREVDPKIVGIGASAGGVQALKAFFAALPTDTGAAFVVIIHLDPAARSELAAILATRTSMPVKQVERREQLRANQVYVIPPNCSLRIADHMIETLPAGDARGRHTPIDLFLRSLADQHSDAFAVVLTGAGADGAVGVKAVKAAGGIVLVQDPNEAEYASMPRSAIATEVADFVLPLRGLAETLADLLKKSVAERPAAAPGTQDDTYRRIVAHIRARTGHDFSQYKRPTLQRRIYRRVQVTRRTSLSDYYSFLRENAEESQALFGEFLISVTTFFRDPAAFETLKKLVIPQLFEGKDAAGTLRVWVPGCATGEEVYTLGMLILEEAGLRDIMPEIQLFASDLDSGALAAAREGRFPIGIESDVGEERLRRFFTKEGDHYVVRRELRDIVLFASHSMLRDPPFTRLDLISCRNLLIYLDRELQSQVCATFHYALNPNGFLFLGSSESADQPAGLFRSVERESRIYRAVAARGERRALPALIGNYSAADRMVNIPRPQNPAPNPGDAAMHRHMLERIAPPSLLVNEAQRVIHLSENAGRYLQPSGGPISIDATDMVRPELRFDLRAALHRAFERGEQTLSMAIPVQFNGHPVRVHMSVRPVTHDNDGRYALVMFLEGEAASSEPEDAQTPAQDALLLVRRLQEELEQAQGRLRTMREESEVANEELRAANEELQSINEEYRSTSEELETSKEELQSVNEELRTVNNELKLKLEGVSRAHSDLQNLMASTDVSTLFLDLSLRIKRFTPRLIELFNVTVNDEGRPITDFTHQLDYPELAEHALAVLRDLTPVEHEVRRRGGAGWYLVRMRPYRTVDHKIDGIVVTFVDVTQRRAAEAALRESEARLSQEMRLVELSHAPMFTWEFEGGITQWNRGCAEIHGFSQAEALGRDLQALLHTQVPGSSREAMRNTLIETGSWSGEVLHTRRDGAVLTVEIQAELAAFEGRRLVMESARDVTAARQWERQQALLLNELNHRVKNMLTVVQSIARQSFRAAGTSDLFYKTFEGRLLALANAHKILVESKWEGAELRDLVRSQIEAYEQIDRDRIVIEGPSIRLPPDLATPAGLVLYELATNAVKYGALSKENGKVRLSWQVEKRDQAQHLTVVWEEQDGPPVRPPTHNGFGKTLIERSLRGADVRYEFPPSGVKCTIGLDIAV